MLEIDRLSASYGTETTLHSVSASFAKGRLCVLLGPNGCGKSTLLKAAMGFVGRLGGEVRLDGVSLSAMGRRQMARRIAYLPQECHCPDYLSVGALIEMSGHMRHGLLRGSSQAERELYQEVLGVVGLSNVAHLPVNSLSGGQRQRAFIAMALAQDTDVILMDEPVNHLDLRYQYSVLEMLRDLARQKDKIVIAVLHDINLAAAFADDVVLMYQGRAVAAGPFGQTVTPASLAEVFDMQVDVFHRDGRAVCLPIGQIA